MTMHTCTVTNSAVSSTWRSPIVVWNGEHALFNTHFRSAYWRRSPARPRRKFLYCTAVGEVDSQGLFDAEAALEQCSVENFYTEESTAVGRLIIRAMQACDMRGAAYVLTRSFAGSPGSIPLDDVTEYVEDMVTAPPRGVLLVGRVTQPDEGKERVVGTAALSFTPDTRERFPSLQPPEDQALLCNMAVDPKFRRQGIARQLLTAAEELTRCAGLSTIYLHVRLADEVAMQLYRSMGYIEADRDSWLVALRNIIPRALMMKHVAPP